MKCVCVRFSPSKQQSFSWKVPLNSCLIGFDQLYTERAGGSFREKALNKILATSSQCVSRSVVITRAESPEFDFLFSSSLLLLVSFPFRLVFFLIIVVSSYSLSFLIHKLSSLLPYFLSTSFSRSPWWGPAIHVFLVIMMNVNNPVALSLSTTEGYKLSRPMNTKITLLLFIDHFKEMPRRN